MGLNKKIEVTHDHVKAFSWLMFMCDGSNSNFDISTRSGIELSLINEAIALFYQNGLLKFLKLLLFSGSHPRHLFVNQIVPTYFDECLIFVMRREELIPPPPTDITPHDQALYSKHFQSRFEVETRIYGKPSPEDVFGKAVIHYLLPEELNTERVANLVTDFNADFCFVFGTNLILDPVIGCLPKDKINLHLGLSPQFKGGATLFWPFYMLKPQYCGVTFHQITESADAGEIIHQSVPLLERGQTLHESCC